MDWADIVDETEVKQVIKTVNKADSKTVDVPKNKASVPKKQNTFSCLAFSDSEDDV